MNARRILVVLALTGVGAASQADAHSTSTSYLNLETRHQRPALHGRLDVAAADLDFSLQLDADGSGSITWAEILASERRIADLVTTGLAITRDDDACSVRISDLALSRHAGEPHVSLLFDAACLRPGAIGVDGRLFFSDDASQRMLVRVVSGNDSFLAALAPGNSSWREPQRQPWWSAFAAFVWQGMLHVWAGYDHIAFIVLLLLPSVLRSNGARWQSADSPRDIARELFLIVTAFTVAHSVTLTLAATGLATLPAKPIEAAIALSIIVAAIINLIPRAAPLRLPVAFGFGLVHGFGFANVFVELGASGTALLPALGGFNVGVELAQLTIVAIALPALLLLRRSPLYARRLMPALSLAIACAGAVWFAERIV